MSQNSTTTTSFIISSNESLNKPSLSSSQSAGSCDYTTASDSSQNNRFTSSLDQMNYDNDMLNQKNRLESTMLPAQLPHQTYSLPGEQIYEPPQTIQPNNQQPRNSQANFNSNLYGADNSMSETYMTYYQNGDEQLKRLNSSSNYTTQQLSQAQHYISGCDSPNLKDKSIDVSKSQLIKNSPTQYTNGNYQYTKYDAYSPVSKPSVQSFQQGKQAKGGHKSSHSSLESSTSCSVMPLNVKSMLINGVSNKEVMCVWLKSIKCGEFTKNFIDNGYDMPLLSKMTPQDLTAIGCKSPETRKKLLYEIRKLNLEDGIPERRPHNLQQWLEMLKLRDYYVRLCDEGYDTIDKVCELTWEDLEEIGINKLGHQKRLLLGIEKVLKFERQQEELKNDYAIYDVHPNHRISLNPSSSDNRLCTISRSKVRSGFFQTKSSPKLDHRGLPVATVMPALKHVNNSLVNLDISRQVLTIADISKSATQSPNGQSNNRFSVHEQNNQMQSTCTLESSPAQFDNQAMTLKRNPPPLPPVRSNSLKMPQSSGIQIDNNNLIYGNNYGVAQSTGMNYGPVATISSNGFLRDPILAGTTNNMPTPNGQISSLNGQANILRSIMPVREAPLPPILSQTHLATTTMRGRIDEEEPLAMDNYPPKPPANNVNGVTGESAGAQLITQSLIGHQLASADEFPPPPPPPPSA